MADLKAQLNDAVKDAMRNKDKDRLTTLRMATAAIKQIEVDERIELDEARILAVLEKMIKQRKDAAAQFDAGNRPELAAKELAEVTVLQTFLPAALSDAELDGLISATLEATGASGMKDMGKVMAQLKPQVQGRADMGQVSARIKARLNG